MTDKARTRYLRDHAEPEAQLAAHIDETYSAAVVVPVRAEPSDIIDRIERSASSAPGRVLGVLVVNGRDGEPHVLRDNERFAGAAARSGEVRRLTDAAWLVRRAASDLLVVDRYAQNPFVEGQGVGHARKIGGDVALALHERGRVRSHFMHQTDGDALLPPDYFRIDVPRACGAAVYPFSHEPCGDPAIDEAHTLYEIGLRHYVLGLRSAGSRYAFHTVGSTMALPFDAYAAVRGVPRREAAEDFYLLNKLSKIGDIVQLRRPVMALMCRVSDRVPFGTGAAARRIVAEGFHTSYDPRCFTVLAVALRLIDAAAAREGVTRDNVAERLLGFESSLTPAVARDLAAYLCDDLRLLGRAEEAADQTHSAVAAKRRVHDWFDALRTLKLVHWARDRHFPELPVTRAAAHWKTASDAVRLGPSAAPMQRPSAPSPGPDAQLAWLRELDAPA